MDVSVASETLSSHMRRAKKLLTMAQLTRAPVIQTDCIPTLQQQREAKLHIQQLQDEEQEQAQNTFVRATPGRRSLQIPNDYSRQQNSRGSVRSNAGIPKYKNTNSTVKPRQSSYQQPEKKLPLRSTKSGADTWAHRDYEQDTAAASVSKEAFLNRIGSFRKTKEIREDRNAVAEKEYNHCNSSGDAPTNSASASRNLIKNSPQINRKYQRESSETSSQPINSTKIRTSIPVYNFGGNSTIREGLVHSNSNRNQSNHGEIITQKHGYRSMPTSPTPNRRVLPQPDHISTQRSNSRSRENQYNQYELGLLQIHDNEMKALSNFYNLSEYMDDSSTVISDYDATGYYDGSSEASYSISASQMDIANILQELSSSEWQQRRNGLINLQHYIKNELPINATEFKKMTDIFTKMFHDPNSKVHPLFLDLLPEFLLACLDSFEESNWMYTCLTRLFQRCGAALLGSVQNKVYKALETIRDNFSCQLQFQILSKIVNDASCVNNIKIREAIICYIHGLSEIMSACDFSNDETMQLIVPRIILWYNDTKTIDIKKWLHSTLLNMFNINPPEFSAFLSTQPNYLQDFAQRLLKHNAQFNEKSPSLTMYNSIAPFSPVFNTSSGNTDYKMSNWNTESNYLQELDPGETPKAYSPARSQSSAFYSDTQATLPHYYEDSSLFSQQSPVCRRNVDSTSRSAENKEAIRVHRNSKDSGVYFSDEPSREGCLTVNMSAFASPNFQVAKEPLGAANEKYESIYFKKDIQLEDDVDLSSRITNNLLISESFTKKEVESIINILTHHSTSESDKKAALKNVLKLSNINDSEMLFLLEPLLIAADDVTELSMLAFQCVSKLLSSRGVGERVDLLRRLIDNCTPETALLALKLQKTEIEAAQLVQLKPYFPDIVISCIKAFESNIKAVRTASVLNLVELYKIFGEEIWNNVHNLNEHKINFLKMYLKK